MAMSVFATKDENRFPLTFREFANVSKSLFGTHSELCLSRTRCSRLSDLCSTRRCRDICARHTDSGTSRRGPRSSVTPRYVQVCLSGGDYANLTLRAQDNRDLDRNMSYRLQHEYAFHLARYIRLPTIRRMKMLLLEYYDMTLHYFQIEPYVAW